MATKSKSAVSPVETGVRLADAGPRLLRIKQAAEYLSVTPWFVRSLIWSRAIPFLLLGKRHLIDRADLDTYVDRMKGEFA